VVITAKNIFTVVNSFDSDYVSSADVAMGNDMEFTHG